MATRDEILRAEGKIDWKAIGDRYATILPGAIEACETFNQKSGLWTVMLHHRSIPMRDLPSLSAQTGVPREANQDRNLQPLSQLTASIAEILSTEIPTRATLDTKSSSDSIRYYKFFPKDFSPFLKR